MSTHLVMQMFQANSFLYINETYLYTAIRIAVIGAYTSTYAYMRSPGHVQIPKSFLLAIFPSRELQPPHQIAFPYVITHMETGTYSPREEEVYSPMKDVLLRRQNQAHAKVSSWTPRCSVSGCR